MKNVLTPWRRGVAAVHVLWQSHWLGSRLQRALKAWRDELVAMLPPAVAARLSRGANARRVTWPLTQEVDTPHPVILLLPAHEAMVQRVTLPLAATRHLYRVLRHELDKYFPYAAEQLHFVARVVHRHGAQAEVEVIAVARERLEAQLRCCRDRGLRVHSIDVLDHSGRQRDVDLMPAGAGAGASRGVRLDRWLGCACLILAVGLAAGYLHRQQRLLESMQETVDRQQAQVRHVQQLRRALDDTVSAGRYLDERRAAHPPISALLAELTTCLDDDHWVEQLSVENSEALIFSGQSAHASALIDQIRQCPSLEQARFQGVIQTDERTGQERYSVRAQLRAPRSSTQGGDHAHID